MRSSKPLAAALILLSFSALPAIASGPASPFVHRKKYAMGTVFEMVVYDASPAHASTAIDQAFDAIARLDHLMSNYEPNSELTKLNSSAKLHSQMVSADLYRVIEQSLEYSHISGGRFDVTVGPLVDLWKAAILGNGTPSTAQQVAARACVGYEKIHLVAPNQVAFVSPCLSIDLGGIGKGYAVDRAAEILEAAGIKTALIDAGGSTIYAMGSPPGQTGWLVHMRDPSRQVDPTIVMSDESLSTSEQTPPSLLATISAGHIIDPETGDPLKTHFAVSVVARTATATDALSTTLLLLGPEAGKRILAKIADTAAIWITPQGELCTVSTGPAIVLGHQFRARLPGVVGLHRKGCE